MEDNLETVVSGDLLRGREGLGASPRGGICPEPDTSCVCCSFLPWPPQGSIHGNSGR